MPSTVTTQYMPASVMTFTIVTAIISGIVGIVGGSMVPDVYGYAYMYMCICICVYVYMYVYMHMCICICAYVYVYVNIF